MVAAAERVKPASIAGWWHDTENVSSLYEWLCMRGWLDPSDVKAVARFLDKPWNWSVEYREMISDSLERDAT